MNFIIILLHFISFANEIIKFFFTTPYIVKLGLWRIKFKEIHNHFCETIMPNTAFQSQ